MDTTAGFIRMNLHKIRKTIDASNQVTPTRLLERVVSIKDGVSVVKSTISNNVATITEDGYGEGDEVDMWITCTRPSEGGGICEQIIVQEDEDTWQDYLDAQ